MIRKFLIPIGLLAVALIAFAYAEQLSLSESDSTNPQSPSHHQLAQPFPPTYNAAAIGNNPQRSSSTVPTVLASHPPSIKKGDQVSRQTYEQTAVISVSAEDAEDIPQTPSDAPTSPPLKGTRLQSTPVGDVNRLLMQAARALENNTAIQANLRYRINLFDQKLNGPGFYVQQGSGSGRWRMELHGSSPQSKFRLAHLSDGRFYYRFHEVNGQSELAFVDTFRLDRNSSDQPKSELSEWTSPWSHLGGLPATLKHLAIHFVFEPVRSETIDDRSVYYVQGRLDENALAKHSIHESNTPTVLSERMPQRVELWLGQEDDDFVLFPYRMVFHASPVEGKQTLRSIIQLDFFNLKQLKAVNPALFTVDTPSTGSTDLTSFYPGIR
ncbi:MAG TPA: hypothetical protein PKD64_15900 [Pirellulaceae bacterium]|nr:hypothetical protein [Pirellulaceae bacterium]HMO93671.1 hypothetical protein [Pirellulaceae bacterium]HMP68413.1 hypothetical protein [Pirellulaceae bacterium]